MKFLGLDVGGANTKAALVTLRGGVVESLACFRKYCPLWRLGKDSVPRVLEELRASLCAKDVDGVSLTMTAELCDVFWCKREGVEYVVDATASVFGNVPLFVLSSEGKLLKPEEAKANALSVASANWYATGWLVSKIRDTCVVIDTGSTTTTITPVVRGSVAAKGMNDLEKLAVGELVYTGALRTNVAAIVDSVPVRGDLVPVSSELFALSGDVHLVLGHITEREYATETADGRGKSRREALARLARVVCADVEMLTEDEIIEIARFIHEVQVEKIATALRRVYGRLLHNFGVRPPAIVAGVGARFLAAEAATRAGVSEVLDLGALMGEEASAVAPAVGAALILADEHEPVKSVVPGGVS